MAYQSNYAQGYQVPPQTGYPAQAPANMGYGGGAPQGYSQQSMYPGAQQPQQNYPVPPQAPATLPAPDDLLDWDSEIENDSEGFVLLPPGLYHFRVASFDRARFPGSAKIPPCNKATLHLELSGDGGTGSVTDDIIMAKKMEWRVSEFFRAIGQKKHGEKLKMNWNQVPGAVGVCEIEVQTWRGRDGQDRQSNRVRRYIDFDPNNGFTAADQTGEVPFN